ncbi:3-methyladenine DNA glycosylase AlkD [Rubricella aquisinus]|uniref:3-methyladenine DNA glycosylase AlkD n=1 Tax=Rubricella aquisinus TaxID=2028108 RepID=A0A840X1Y8_9RHOB|nr:DNA alkylation repair protein [Rubricella aquisinus]MBB5515876.1 3-methyladenine DNA glycosylase AlkD [Rubricella aquisinus]
MTPGAALAELEARANPAKAADMARYHKAKRRYLGLANPTIDALCKEWRAEMALDARVTLAAGLWDSDVFEARIAAGKLFTQARIRPDDAVWAEICRWMPMLDSWAIADQVASAGARRLTAEPARLETVADWTTDPNKWVRRAALVFTLPWAKLPHPNAVQTAERERILGWAEGYATDHDWFIQKAIGWWLRTLSRHDAARVIAFTDAHGDKLKPFALREALRSLP